MWEIGLVEPAWADPLPIGLGQDMPVQYADRSHDGRYLALASPEDQGDGPLVYRRFVLGMTTGEIVPQQTPDVSVQMFGPDHWTDAPASIVLGRDDTGDPLGLFEVEPSTGAARDPWWLARRRGGVLDADLRRRRQVWLPRARLVDDASAPDLTSAFLCGGSFPLCVCVCLQPDVVCSERNRRSDGCHRRSASRVGSGWQVTDVRRSSTASRSRCRRMAGGSRT